MTSLRLINLSEITVLEPFASSHKFDVAVQSCTDEDDDSVTLAHTDGLVLAFSEPNQSAEIAWKCDDGDHITAIAWFYVTTKLSILMAGFQSGMIRVFDRAGNALFSQHLHRGGIMSLKSCPSVGLQRSTTYDLLAVYSDILLHIEGESIFNSLCNSMSQSRHRSVMRDEPSVMSSFTTAWRFCKYQLQGQSSVHDVIPIAHPRKSLSVNPMTACFLGVGANLMLAVYPVFGQGGASTFSAVNVAAAVATKLTSAVFSFVSNKVWGTSGDQPKEVSAEVKAQQEPPHSLPLQRSARDSSRTLTSISSSPDSKLAATCDSFGRVILWDLQRLLAIRVFKGYRDAQTEFVTLKDRQHAEPVLFLAIYLGRRGLLEVWRVPLGVRVGIVQVGTNCLLRSSMALTAHLSTPNQLPKLSMAFLIRSSGAVARIVFDPNIHALPADQFFLSNARLMAVDVAHRLLSAARQQVVRWQRNHLCIHCATDIDLQNFELDSTVSSHDLLESLLRLCCLPTSVSVSVDSLLADLFPRVFPSQSPDTQFAMPSFCVGYLNDLIAMLERAVSETLSAVASLQPNLLLTASSASSPVLLPSSSAVPPPIDINSHAPTVARPVWSARTLARDVAACLALQQSRVHCLLLVALLRTYLEGVGNTRRTASDQQLFERKLTHSKETSGIDDFDVDNFDSVPIATASSKSSTSQNSLTIYDFLASFDCLSFFGEYAALWSAALAETQTLSVSSHTLSASTTVDSIAIRVASWSLPVPWSLDIHSLTGQSASNTSSGLNVLLASQIRLRLKSEVARNAQLAMQVARVLLAPVFVFLLESPNSESENSNSFEVDAAFVSQAPISSLPLCGDDWLPWLPKVMLSMASTQQITEFPSFTPSASSLLPLLSCFAEPEHISQQTHLLYRALSSKTPSDSNSKRIVHRFVSVLHALQHALLCSTRAAVKADVRYTTFQQSISAPLSTSKALAIATASTVTASQRLPPLSSVVDHLSKHILPLLLELPSVSSFCNVSANASVLLLGAVLAETSHRLSSAWIHVLQSSNDKRDATTHTISQIPWLRLQRRLLSAYLIDSCLNDPTGHNTALVSLAQLSTCSSICSSIIAPYLLKLGMPLPALIACITSALPVVTNDISNATANQINELPSIQPDAEPTVWMSRASSWRCASLESVLVAQTAPAKATGKKALPPVVSRSTPATSLIDRVYTAAVALRNLHIAFPQHVFSDQQVGVSLVIDLMKRFCQHQSAHVRVPMAVYAKIDPILAQSVTVLESVPCGVAAASCALAIWQSVLAPTVSSWLTAASESKTAEVVTIRTTAILDLSVRLLKALKSSLSVTGIIGFRSLDQSNPDQVPELELEQLQQLSRLSGVSSQKLLHFKLHSQSSADIDQLNQHHLSMLARSMQRQPLDVHVAEDHHIDEHELSDVELDETLLSLDIPHKTVLMDSWLPAGDRQLSTLLSCLQITLAPLAPKFANQEHPLDMHIDALMQACAWLRAWVDVHASTVTDTNNKVLDVAAPLPVFPLAAFVTPGFTTSLMNPDAVQFANQSDFHLESVQPLPAQVPLSTQQTASARSACLSAMARRLALATSVPALFQLPARAPTSSWMPRLLSLCADDSTLTQAVHASVLGAWLESWSDSLVEEQLLLIDDKHHLAASISRAALDRLACLTQFIVFIPATSPAPTQTLARRLVALISAVSVQKLAAHVCSDVARRSLTARLDSVAGSHKITTYSTEVVLEVFAVAVRACSHWLKLTAKWSPADSAQYAWASETCTQLLAGLQAVTT